MIDVRNADYIVVGCGFWGSVFAERLASVSDKRVIVIDKRNHIGGNCYSEVDEETGIEFHKYGSHIFHTNSKKVWNYLNNFGEFNSYRHQVITVHNGKHYVMPVNLLTVNEFYGVNLQPYEVEEFIKKEVGLSSCTTPRNLEEKAVSQMGKPLYEAFVKGYTEKQWKCSAKELPASIINRLPIRKNFRTGYFDDEFEGIPLDGWTKMFQNILSHPNISVLLNTDFFDIKDKLKKNCKIIYTGRIDKLFDYKFGKLEWLGLDFKYERLNCKDWQGTSVVNYSDLNVPQTRTHEFKHLHLERKEIFESEKTLISYEFSKKITADDEIYYPVPTERNLSLYQKYREECTKEKNIILGGRLGLYRYADIDTTVENALLTYEELKGSI